MIEEAVLVERIKNSNSDPAALNPVALMSSHVGTELCFLLTNDDNSDDQYGCWQDWGSLAGTFRDLSKHLLMLLTIPENIERIPAYLRETAAGRLFKLHDFFDHLTGEFTYTEEWLTWTRLTDYPDHNKNEMLDLIIGDYDFKNWKSSRNYFHRKGFENIENMKQCYPAVHAVIESREDSE